MYKIREPEVKVISFRFGTPYASTGFLVCDSVDTILNLQCRRLYLSETHVAGTSSIQGQPTRTVSEKKKTISTISFNRSATNECNHNVDHIGTV